MFVFINTGSESPLGQCANARKSCSGWKVKPSFWAVPDSPGRKAVGLCCCVPMSKQPPHVLLNSSLWLKQRAFWEGYPRSKGMLPPGKSLEPPPPFPAILQLWASQVLAQRLRLWGWALRPRGSVLLGQAIQVAGLSRPCLIAGGQRQNAGNRTGGIRNALYIYRSSGGH